VKQVKNKQHKHQFSKLDVEFKEGDIDSIVTKAERYRELIVQVIDSKIKDLSRTIDFDKSNYTLRRAHNDGGADHLNKLKEIINDV
jgi:hypothetical protein